MLRVILFAILFSVAWSLTCSEQTELEKYFLSLLRYKAKNEDPTPGDTAAGWVRLCFHDAGTWDWRKKEGGSHACIWEKCSAPKKCEWNHPGNNGIQPIVNELEHYYQKERHYKLLSRPDYWQLACKVAIEYASGFRIKLRWAWGRTDCASSTPLFEHPDAEEGFDAIEEYLVEKNGFNWEEAVALLGSHVLGRARRANTGYSGRWVPSPANLFSNNYFKVLLGHKWYRRLIPSYKGRGDKVQFNSPDRYNAMMLFPDVSMKWDIGESRTVYGCNVTSHRYNSCPVAKNKHDTANIVEQFADDEDYFFDVFADAWWKLQGFGGDDLSENEGKVYWDDDSSDYWHKYLD